MSYVLAFYGVKDGQGLTTTALGVAAELARQHSVLFVDADMSGTGTAADSLQVDPAGHGMHNLLGGGQISAGDLVAQAVPTKNRNLGLVPGLAAVCGSSPTRLVERLREGGALSMPSVELIVLDLGSIAHPDQRSLRQAASAITTVAHRVFTVIKDDPPVLARAVQVLRAAAPPKTEVLVVEHRRGALRKHVEQVLQLRVPEVAIGPPIAWDPGRARAALDAGRPMDMGPLARQLQLVERAQPVLAAVATAADAGGAGG